MKYLFNKGGIFAVIFYPSMEKNQAVIKEIYCGIICQNKRIFFIALFIGIPILCILNYFFYYFFERYLEEDHLKMKKIFISKKMHDIENINLDLKGQTIFEKLEEGVQYFVNPVRNEKEEDLASMKDLFREKEKLEEEKQKLLKAKNQLIATNKKKIEQIKSLREQIDELGNEDNADRLDD